MTQASIHAIDADGFTEVITDDQEFDGLEPYQENDKLLSLISEFVQKRIDEGRVGAWAIFVTYYVDSPHETTKLMFVVEDDIEDVFVYQMQSGGISNPDRVLDFSVS